MLKLSLKSIFYLFSKINCMYTPCLVPVLICSVNQVMNWPPNSSKWMSEKMISCLYCTSSRKILLHQTQIHIDGDYPILKPCHPEHMPTRTCQKSTTERDSCITSIQRSLPIIHHCALCNCNGAQQQRGQMDRLWVSFSWPLYFIKH